MFANKKSLGGALCTLFAFGLASRTPATQIPLPITIVSVASPKVGNNSWRKAFEYLEEEGMLRHLRIANSRDPITLVPPSTASYRHVGLKLKLMSDGKHKFSYATGDLRKDLFNPVTCRAPSNHYGDEYGRLLLVVREQLKGFHLNELYLKRDTLKELTSDDG